MPSDWLKVPHRKQSHDGACLPACARMVMAYFGREVEEADLSRQLRSRPFGTRSSHIRLLEEWGWSVIYREGTLLDLQSHVASGVPCIAFVRAGVLPGWETDTSHSVVVVGFSVEDVVVHDPAAEPGPERIPLESLMLAWSEFDYVYAALAPGSGKP